MGRSSSLGGCFSLTLAFVGAIARLRQWPGGFAVGSRPVGRMGLQCVARVRGVRCVCCVSPTLSRLFALAILMVGGWVFLISRPAWAIAALLALGWSRSDCSRARHASNTC